MQNKRGRLVPLTLCCYLWQAARGGCKQRKGTTCNLQRGHHMQNYENACEKESAAKCENISTESRTKWLKNAVQCLLLLLKISEYLEPCKRNIYIMIEIEYFLYNIFEILSLP